MPLKRKCFDPGSVKRTVEIKKEVVTFKAELDNHADVFAKGASGKKTGKWK